jgi:hypothetical protein
MCTESGYAKLHKVISELSFMLIIKRSPKPNELQNYKHILDCRMVNDAKKVSGRQ